MTLIYKGYLRMLTVLDYKLFMAGMQSILITQMLKKALS